MKDFSIARNAWNGHASWSRCPRSPPCRDLERDRRLGSRSWCGQAWPATLAIGLLPASQDRVRKMPERSNRAISKLLAQVMTTTNSGAPVMSQVRTRLAAGGNRIRTIGPAPAKGSSGRCQSETAARKAEPLTGSGPRRRWLPGVAPHSLSLRGGTASSNPSSSSGESTANPVGLAQRRH